MPTSCEIEEARDDKEISLRNITLRRYRMKVRRTGVIAQDASAPAQPEQLAIRLKTRILYRESIRQSNT